MRLLGQSMLLLAIMCATASAGTKTTITFDQATTRCEHKTEPASGDKDAFEVVVADSENPADGHAKAAIDLQIAKGGSVKGQGTVVAQGTALSDPVSITAAGGETIQVGPAGTQCQFVFAKPATPPAGVKKDEAAAPRTDADNAELNERGRQYLRDQGIVDHAKSGGPTGRTFKLYHLPDGTPAFPMPNDLSEEDHVEPWIVVIAGEQVSAEVTICKGVPAVRISGTPPSIGEPPKEIKGGPAVALPPPPPMHLRRISAPLQCADDLSYKVRTAHGEHDVSFKIDPVYRFSWGAAYGFDFSRPTRLHLVERPSDGGMGATERVIVQDNDRSAFRPMVTLTLNACNANLKSWDACDAIGLTAMADLGRLTQGGALGVKLQPYPGLGVLIGMTFFQVDTIATGHSMKVGDVFSGPGDLPIDKQFTNKSVGLFLGVGGDTDTVKALFVR